MIVQDVDRPDINGVKPKMQSVSDQVQKELEKLNLPFCVVKCDDNIMSSVSITISFQKKEDWPGGIFQNSTYLKLSIVPEKGKRYFNEGEKVTVEHLCGWKLSKKFRKRTATPEKATAGIVKYLKEIM